MSIKDFIRNPILRRCLTVLIVAVALLQCVFVFSGMFFLAVDVSTESPGELYVVSKNRQAREEISRCTLAGGGKEEYFETFFFARSRKDVELEFRGDGQCTIRRISFLHRSLIFRFEKIKRYLFRDQVQTEDKTFELEPGRPSVLPLDIQDYSRKMNVPGVISLWILQICLLVRFFDLLCRLFKWTGIRFVCLLKSCAAIDTKRFTGLDSKFRIQEILLLSTVLPVVFLDYYTEKAAIFVLVVILEFLAFAFSLFGAVENAKAGEKCCGPNDCADATVDKKRYTGFNYRFRIQEILLLSTVLPVVFLDYYTEKATIFALVVILEFLAFVFSLFGAVENAKAGEKHPYKGLLLFLLVTVLVDLCLLEVCRLKYTNLFGDESEKFMLPYFLHNGYKLYDTAFCHHGPFMTILPHLIYILHPVNDIGVFRASGFLVLLLPTILFLFTDIVPKRSIRIAVSLMFPCLYLLVVFIYSYYGEGFLPCSIVLYQFFGAVFIGCALILLYPLLFQEKYNMKYLFWAGLFLSFSFFCAISFSISVFIVCLMVLLFCICNFHQAIKKYSTLLFFVYGGVAGIILVLLWLMVFGSVRGFIEQHILFNLQVYSKYIQMDDPTSSFTLTVKGIPKWILEGTLCFVLLTSLFVFAPLSFLFRFGNVKRALLHFVFCAMMFLTAFLSCRIASYYGFGFMFSPLGQSGYVILTIVACVLLSDLDLRRTALVIAAGLFCALLMKEYVRFHIPESSRFLQLQQKEIKSTEIVQKLTLPEDPVLFYMGGFADYVGDQRLPGGVSFPFITLPIYEYGKERLYAELQKTMPVIISFFYEDYKESFSSSQEPLISEFLDFIKDEGYMQILGTDYYVLPERCSRQEELAQYELVPIIRHNQSVSKLHPFMEINRENRYCGKLVYSDKLGDSPVTGIAISFPTFSRSGSELDGEMNVQFLSEQGEIMYEYSMDCTRLIDNKTFRFAFDSPCRPASVCVSSTSSPGKGFSVWLNQDERLRVGAFLDPIAQSSTVRRVFPSEGEHPETGGGSLP